MTRRIRTRRAAARPSVIRLIKTLQRSASAAPPPWRLRRQPRDESACPAGPGSPLDLVHQSRGGRGAGRRAAWPWGCAAASGSVRRCTRRGQADDEALMARPAHGAQYAEIGCGVCRNRVRRHRPPATGGDPGLVHGCAVVHRGTIGSARLLSRGYPGGTIHDFVVYRSVGLAGSTFVRQHVPPAASALLAW